LFLIRVEKGGTGGEEDRQRYRRDELPYQERKTQEEDESEHTKFGVVGESLCIPPVEKLQERGDESYKDKDRSRYLEQTLHPGNYRVCLLLRTDVILELVDIIKTD